MVFPLKPPFFSRFSPGLLPFWLFPAPPSWCPRCPREAPWEAPRPRAASSRAWSAAGPGDHPEKWEKWKPEIGENLNLKYGFNREIYIYIYIHVCVCMCMCVCDIIYIYIYMSSGKLTGLNGAFYIYILYIYIYNISSGKLTVCGKSLLFRGNSCSYTWAMFNGKLRVESLGK